MAYLAAENWACNYNVQDSEQCYYQNDLPNTNNNISSNSVLDSLLLDESHDEDYYYDDEDGERLKKLIQSLEAEIDGSNQASNYSYGDGMMINNSIEARESSESYNHFDESNWIMEMEIDDSSSTSNGDLHSEKVVIDEAFDDMIGRFEEAKDYYY
ncbi:hypothetical protein LIER_08250 [Lithospermum erythrorhizon]|uniref:Uncharacterized protein n=1 Tax=Lithospermum erythrorhizon TaxID=34254 RepID=A0AAV3PBA4_LITER